MRLGKRPVGRAGLDCAPAGAAERYPRHVVRALYGGHGPALVVSAFVAAGVVAPGWMLVLGAMASVPGWAVLAGATAATVLAYVAVTIATGLQRAVVREVRGLTRCQHDCGYARLTRPVGPGAVRGAAGLSGEFSAGPRPAAGSRAPRP